MNEDGEGQQGAIWSRIVIEEVKILIEERYGGIDEDNRKFSAR